jgi:hypothetical protein
MSYNYEEKARSHSNYLQHNLLSEEGKYKELTKSEFSQKKQTKGERFTSFVTSLSVKLNIKTDNDSLKRDIYIRICEDLLSSYDSELVDINYSMNSITLIFLTPYKEDIVVVYNDATLFNTILIMFAKLAMKHSRLVIEHSISMHTYQVYLFTIGKNSVGLHLLSPIDSIFSEHLVENVLLKKNGKIALSQVSYSNIIDLLKNTNEDYLKWIVKAYDRVLNNEYYICDVVRSLFSEYLDQHIQEL